MPTNTHWKRAVIAYRDSGGRVRLAWYLLVSSVLGWPLSVVWVIDHEGRFDPFEQLMLFLSWGALAYGAFSAVNSAEVREQNNTCPECPHCKEKAG